MGKRGNRRRKDTNSHNNDDQNLSNCLHSNYEISDTGIEYPFNKDAYRYHLAEPDRHVIGENYDWSIWLGKPIPGKLYRIYVPSEVTFSPNDRDNQIQLSPDRLNATGFKGYSMIRATHGVSHGAWYFELKVTSLEKDSAIRAGWSQQQAILQAPCGYDKFGYSWRSIKGTKFHQSIGRHYCSEGYQVDDVLGFYIYLTPPLSKMAGKYCYRLPSCHKNEALIKYKNYFFFEERQHIEESVKELTVLPGSKIVFYKNGVSQGVAYTDIFDGRYYPSVSLFRKSTVKINFGPQFEFPPDPSLIGEYRPMSDAAQLNEIEQTLSNIYFIGTNLK